MVDLRTYLIRPASRSMMLRSAPTASARSVCVQGQHCSVPQVVMFKLVRTDFVDNEQISTCDPRPSFPGHFIPTRNVNHIDDEIRQLAAVVRRQIVASTLDQEDVGAEGRVQRLQRVEVCRDVLAHGGVRAAASLNGKDTGGRQRRVACEELGIFSSCYSALKLHLAEGLRSTRDSIDGSVQINVPCEYIVCDGCNAVFISESEAKLQHQGCFARAHRPTWHQLAGCSRLSISPSLLLSIILKGILPCPSICLWIEEAGAYPPIPTVNARSFQSRPSTIGISRKVYEPGPSSTSCECPCSAGLKVLE